ncbi:hypothetical protein SAMN05443270_3097 [Lacrimispora sphenoides]|uniref:hypothetical protein n=1 Tax=Lacrimispora sphenoides TaxID=29370 RepID=UPI0008BCA1AF|nr:hypothetical protein [Lacrimispora sphenoides]SEU09486.1 hypothetical protein SAMN05443270_3097 [Lacrimispora sphenoides]
MKKEYETEQFIKGAIAIRVVSDEQSRFLIKLSVENGFENGDSNDYITEDTYKRYPYYYIEDDYQLQASQYKETAIEECGEVMEFETWFGQILDKDK